ncbi:MAG: hypothetical protein PUJ48_06855 [Subdoligranulum variabile]|uniref:hypothetical protein n=1 Tax=Gemmiger sp. TaxID=2049027 RepID=UPI002A90EE6C|nr:hypothetical protein [Gemmiger sp.]MDD7639903.1 hypothetical protein [Subdoligranulum variabile]MDY5605620.1 hypothetical protein [Gemmiger sp.]
MAQTHKNRIVPLLFALLCAASLVVMARSAFVGLEIDEEYALSLGYRLVSGDRLFYSMWEPHQLSSLPAAALLAVFIGITGGTTGVLVFFRLVVLVCKAGMSYVFYREFRRDLGRPAALLAALVLFAFVPKWFLGPDYTGQQFHWTLAAFLCLHHYVTRGCRQLWLVPLGAVCACFGYLAFPQSAAAFAVLWVGMLILGKRRGEPKARGAWVLLGSCAVCGAAFLVYALSGVGFSIPLLLNRLTLILHDPQYNFTTAERMALLAGQALTVARSLLWPVLASAALSAALYLIKRQPITAGRLLNFWAALATVQCLLRAVKDGSLDERQFVPVVVLAGAWAFWQGRGRPGNAELFWLGYLPGLAAYAMILRSTLLGLAPTFMYLTWPAVCGMLALVNHADDAKARRAEGMLCLAAMLAFLLVCRVWCVQTTGWKAADVTDTPLVRITTGPAKGIYADAKAADMQECLCEALQPYAGQPILQAIGEQHGLGFLMADGTLQVAQASVISGTDSDPRFEQYYADVPDKEPRVILYDDAEVRDMAEFHSWLEASFTIVDRYTVAHGSASLQVLLVGDD